MVVRYPVGIVISKYLERHPKPSVGHQQTLERCDNSMHGLFKGYMYDKLRSCFQRVRGDRV